jgi:hypothetical protein
MISRVVARDLNYPGSSHSTGAFSLKALDEIPSRMIDCFHLLFLKLELVKDLGCIGSTLR